ncbi:lipopolysaccharide biosynthesis protein [Aeromonas sp. 82P]|uniref:lipopolysaccharide biosynthesis protein n=1 Tax=Aeromonas sp. 82P TaxID=3452726 RepID=UPI003F79B43E
MKKKMLILYCSQIYRTILPLLFIPLTIAILGPEQYGLISFMTMLLSFLALLDAGVSGTFIRMISIHRNNILEFCSVIKLYNRALGVFLFISILLFLFIYNFSDVISSQWLNTSIDYETTKNAIEIIGFVLGVNYLKLYICSFFYGVEKQVVISVWGCIYTTLFYGGSYLSIRYIESSIGCYLDSIYWISLFDIIVIFLMLCYYIYNKETLCNIEDGGEGTDCCYDKFNLFSVIKQSGYLSCLSLVWIITTQLDKLILSTYTELSDYAHYQIATQLSSLVIVLTMPISQYLMPRLSYLFKTNNILLFKRHIILFICLFILLCTQIVSYFFIYGDGLIGLWMNNPSLGHSVNNYAKWLVLSSYVAALINFLFLVLYAIDDIKSHFYAYLLYSIFVIPSTIFIAKVWGATGCAIFLAIHTSFFGVVWGGGEI